MFFQPFSLRNYRELVEEIHDVIYKIDKNKKIVFINSAVEDLTGYTKDELVDKNFLDFIYHEDREMTEAEFDNLFIKGQCDPVEYRIVRKDKSTIWVRSQSKALKIKGKFVGIQGVLIDINQLKEQNQELSDFSYRVSHDLRNSFITIQNFSELIKEKPNFSDEFHGYIIETCQNSLEYIDQLLKLASSGELIKEKEEIDISCLIKSLYFQYKNKFELNCDTGIIIYADLSSIVEVLKNLFENSIKFKNPEEKLKISITAQKENFCTLVKVQDNGSGIEKEILPLIFKKGFTFRKNGQRGTGFGLAIVKKIIEAHNGQIRVESKGEREGTTFCIKLPNDSE